MWANASSSNRPSDAASSVSAYSATSSFRHSHFAPPSNSTSPANPNPKLMTDSSHKPKTHGSFGVLVVGLGGALGTTMLAGILANRLKIDWRGPKGEPMTPNYYGCITQLDQRGGGVGYRDMVKGLADASMAAVGGWDIRPTKPGDALLEAQILDYDLVRQVQDDMNKVKLFRGLFDPRFLSTIGSSSQHKHETATYILTEQEAKSDSEALKCLRADIRYFKWRNGVVGHTTVIWSASNSEEPFNNSEQLVSNIRTANDLLDSIDQTEEQRGGPLPPSLLYATAALLEGCSFVNGGSQNTLDCPGLVELARHQLGVYCLGTEFKSGPTRFQSAAVEYLRTVGLTPRVIASSSNAMNDGRVKHDNLFANGQEENLDHKVSSSMCTPLFINDDKREFVEYTSLGFLGQTHTMVTYTRASDSILCVPLMIDAAVWCDFFSQRSWPYEKVAKAAAYLFQVPQTQDVDPGFFRQMEELKSQVLAAHESKASTTKGGNNRRVRIRAEEETKTTEWAIPHDARIICAGLACVDMQLNNSTGGDGGEGIETFEGETCIGGGSVSMACKTIARLCHGAPLDDSHMQVTPPVVSSVQPLCMVGSDDSGNKLISLLESCGSVCRNVDTRVIRNARAQKSGLRTALSVLPIYCDGRRGCFFDAASNNTFSPDQMIEMFSELSSPAESVQGPTPVYGSMLFGYPHLLPMMQGRALAYIFSEARKIMIDSGIVALDLNGVPETSFSTSGGLRSLGDLKNDRVIGAALGQVDLLHMNEDELVLLTGCRIFDSIESEEENEFIMAKAVELFLDCGVAVVAVTRGMKGSYVACNNAERFQKTPMLPPSWINCSAHIPAAELPPGTMLNTNGAGDSFTSGLLVATMLRHTGMTVPVRSPAGKVDGFSEPEMVAEKDTPLPRNTPTTKKLTPYTIYMRENYVTLKRQCKDDKKAIFTKCHEMWENESQDVKSMYERMAKEENGESGMNDTSLSFNDIESLGSNLSHGPSVDYDDTAPRNKNMTNKSLNLESAVQFAGLVAAHHVDMSTRDLEHIDISRLLERAMMFHTEI